MTRCWTCSGPRNIYADEGARRTGPLEDRAQEPSILESTECLLFG